MIEGDIDVCVIFTSSKLRRLSCIYLRTFLLSAISYTILDMQLLIIQTFKNCSLLQYLLPQCPIWLEYARSIKNAAPLLGEFKRIVLAKADRGIRYSMSVILLAFDDWQNFVLNLVIWMSKSFGTILTIYALFVIMARRMKIRNIFSCIALSMTHYDKIFLVISKIFLI